MKINLIFILIYILSVQVYSQLNSNAIDDYYKKLDSYNQFNGDVLITKNDTVILNSSYGNFSPPIQFYLGDISNQYISFAAISLITEDKLSETDFVKDYLADFPFPDIQLVHLLTCTSGLTDFKNWRGYVWESKKTLTPSDVLFALKKYSHNPLYKAGKEFNFSNTNFVILILIIEEVTGTQIGDFLKERIFIPYGLQNTEYTTSFSETDLVKPGYVFSIDSNRYINYQSHKNIYDLDIERSIGTVISSIKDLNKWFEISSKLEFLQYKNLDLNPDIRSEQIFPLRSINSTKRYFWSSTMLGNNIRIILDTEQSISFIETSNITTAYTKNDSTFLEVSNQLYRDNATTSFPGISVAEKIKLHPNDYNELIVLLKKSEYQLESSEIIGICNKLSQMNNPELSVKILNNYFENKYSEDYYYALAESYLALNDTVHALSYLDNIITKNSNSYKAKILKNIIDPAFTWNSCYSKKQIVEDIKYLHSSLIKYHPGVYDYLTKEELDSIISNQTKSLSDSINYYDFFKILSTIFPKIKDNHTDFGGSPRHSSEFFKEHLFLPLDVMLINDSLYVTKDCSTLGEIGTGARILAINDRNISYIIKEINDILPSDGNNLTNKAQWYKNFFRGLYISAVEKPTSYIIDFIPVNENKTKTIRIAALSNDSINSIKSQRYGEEAKKENLLSYEQINAETGLLRIKSFDIYALKNNGENFNHFLDSSFAQIIANSIENLIIDLRNNGGGRTPFGMLLYSYLTDKPFTYIDSTIVNKFWDCNYSDNFLRIPRIECDKRSYVQLDNEKYLVKTYPLQYCNTVPKNNFKGDAYILINGGSISCTGLFCSIARKNDRAIFIGEESGSAYGGFSADRFVFLLPNTLFKVFISGMKIKINTEGELARGVIPDYQIQPNIEDILNIRDIELEYTLDLISKKKNE